MSRAVWSVLLAAGASIVGAQDEPAPSRTLTMGKGVELTTARCVLCHDAQHITRTRLSRGEWQFNIKNMIERGAPIAPAEIAPILEYLATYYNRDVAPPAPTVAPANGNPVTRLLTANVCTACHEPDKRLVGPSFREVAAKYANDSAAAGKLGAKIKQGGSGVWGNVSMPPHPAIADSDLQQLVNWILGHK